MTAVATVVQSQTAVHAEVAGSGRAAGDCPLAPGTNARADATERFLVRKRAPAFSFALELHTLSLREIPAHGADHVHAGHRTGQDPHAVAHVAAVTREIRYELHKEREHGEQHEAAPQRPVLTASLTGHEPSGQQQQRQRERQPHAEYA